MSTDTATRREVGADSVAGGSIAEEVGVQPRIVSNWRQRFADHGLGGLKDRPRAGKKLIYGAATNKRILVYPVHVMTRKSFGLMTRKLSVTESQRSAQFPGTFPRRKLSVASANWAQVA